MVVFERSFGKSSEFGFDSDVDEVKEISQTRFTTLGSLTADGREAIDMSP